MFLKVLQNLQENSRGGVLIKLKAWGLNFMKKKKLRHRFFPLTFTKFLRTRFLQSTSGLLPQKSTTAQLDWANLVNCLNLWSLRWFFSLSFFCFVYFYFVSCSHFLFYVFLLYFVVAVVVVVVFTICSLIFWPHLVLYFFLNLVDLYLFFLFFIFFFFFHWIFTCFICLFSDMRPWLP